MLRLHALGPRDPRDHRHRHHHRFQYREGARFREFHLQKKPPEVAGESGIVPLSGSTQRPPQHRGGGAHGGGESINAKQSGGSSHHAAAPIAAYALHQKHTSRTGRRRRAMFGSVGGGGGDGGAAAVALALGGGSGLHAPVSAGERRIRALAAARRGCTLALVELALTRDGVAHAASDASLALVAVRRKFWLC